MARWLALVVVAVLVAAAWIVADHSCVHREGSASPFERIPQFDARTEPAPLDGQLATGARASLEGGLVEGAHEPAMPLAPPDGLRLHVRAVFADDESTVPRLPIFAECESPPEPESGRDPHPPAYWRRSSVTDTEGRLLLDLPDQVEWTLATSLEDATPMPTRIGRAGLAEASVTLRVLRVPIVAFHGRIVGTDDQPIPEGRAVVVHDLLYPANDLAMPVESAFVAPCDADGVFLLELQPWRAALVLVDAPGFSQRTLLLTDGHETRSQALRIPLVHSGAIEFRALDRDGAPMAGAMLRALCACTGEVFSGDGEALTAFVRAGLVWSAELDVEGRCTLSELPADQVYSLSLWRGETELRRAPNTEGPYPGEVDEIVWRLGTGAKVTGQLVDESDRGLPGHEVWLLPDDYEEVTSVSADRRDEIVDRVHTDAQGRFELADVPAGSWKVGPFCGEGPQRDACEFYPLAQPFQVREGSETEHVVVRVKRMSFVSGLVVDHAGVAVRGALVTINGLPFAPATTDVGGRFRIGPFPPGEWSVHAECMSCAQAPSPFVTVQGGMDGVTLRMVKGAVLSGRVIGGPSGTVVRLRLSDPTAERGRRIAESLRTETGAFSFPRLAPGLYDLRGSTKDGFIGITRHLEVEEGATLSGVELRLERQATIVFLGEGIKVWRYVDVQIDGVEWDSRGVEPGSTSEMGVPAGAMRIRVLDAEDAVLGTQDVNLGAGQRLELRVATLGG